MPTPIHRRAVLASAAVSAFAAPRPARAQNRPLRIGVLGDFSNIGRANSGPGSVEAAHLAVEEFGSTVLGRPIEVLQADHQQKPDVGLQIARQWIDTEGVSAIADIPNSSVAFAVTDLAAAKASGQEHMVALRGVAVALEQMPRIQHLRRVEAGLLPQLTAGHLQRIGPWRGLPGALGQLPVASAHGVAELLHEVQAAVGLERDDHHEVRLLDDAVDAFGAVPPADHVLADPHPPVLVHHPRAGRRDVSVHAVPLRPGIGGMVARIA